MERSAPLAPRLIFWELTQRCNLRCAHCRAESPRAAAAGLPFEKIRSILGQIATAYRPLLILTGGEPLLRPDLFEIAAAARALGLPISLASNGTLIDGPTARRISDAGFQRVSVSLDGASAASHDRFRGLPGSFAAALAGIAELKKAGVPFQINYTVVNDNLADFDAVFSLAESLSAAALHLFMLVPVGCGLALPGEQSLSPETYEQVLERFFEKSQHTALETRATCAPHYYRIQRQKGGAGGREGAKGCLAGSAVCFISHTGQVRPCGYFAAAAGDLLSAPFAEIWEKSPLFADLRDPSRLKGKCGACEYAGVCSGCRARALGRGGDYLGEEPFCLYRPLKRGAV